jgi:plasmid maintenance system antidote protein VapI
MTLEKYMELTKLTDAKMADLIDRDRSVVTKLRAGTIKPSFDVMVALERITEGAVRPSDFAA